MSVHQPYFHQLENHATFQEHFTLDKIVSKLCRGLCYGTERIVQLELDVDRLGHHDLFAKGFSSQLTCILVHKLYSSVPSMQMSTNIHYSTCGMIIVQSLLIFTLVLVPIKSDKAHLNLSRNEERWTYRKY